MGDGLIGRMLRALRLDATLYREVAAPGASTEQAALVLVLAAMGFSFASSSAWLATWLNSGWGPLPVEANVPFVMDLQNVRVIARTIALMAAWPIWTAGLWLVTRRLIARDLQPPGYGQIARVIAFGQAPGVLGVVLLVFISVVVALFLSSVPVIDYRSDDLDPMPLPALELVVRAGWIALEVWVFIGTFLAIREGLGLSGGRTLAALVIVGASLAVLLGLLVTVVSVIAAAVGALPLAFGHGPRVVPALDGSAPLEYVASEIPQVAAFGFDFNLVTGISRNLVNRLGDALATVI